MADAAPAPAPSPQPPARRWRKRARRAGIAALVGGGAIALLVAAAPSLVLSPIGEGRIAAAASKRLGTEVELRGATLGWRAPLRVERLRVGDRDEPLLLVEGLSLPVTLWEGISLARQPGPRALPTLTIDSLRVRATRDAQGSIDVLRLVERLGSSSQPAPPSPGDGDRAEAPLPVASARVEIGNVSLLLHDKALGTELGIGEGSVLLDFPAWGRPVTLDLAGELRAGEWRLPWDARAKADGLVDEQGRLRPLDAVLTASSGGLVHEGQMGEGGFFVHAGAAAGTENVARLLVPLAVIGDAARGAGIALPAGDLAGLVDLRARATTPVALDGAWPITASLGLDAAQASTARTSAAPVSLVLDVQATHDAAARTVTGASVTLAGEGLRAEATLPSLDLDHPMAVQGATTRVDVDLAPLTALASRLLGGDGDPMAEGTIAATGTLGRDGAGHAVAWTLDLAPRRLLSLAPAMEDAAWLGEGLDLAPLALVARGELAHDFLSGATRARVDDATGPLTTATTLSAARASGDAPWTLSGEGLVDVAATIAALPASMRPAAATIERAALRWRVDEASIAPGAVGARGSLALDGLAATLADGRAVDLDSATIDVDAALDTTTLEARVESLALSLPGTELALAGDAGTEAWDLAGTLAIDAAPLLDAFGHLAPQPIPATTGVLAIEWSTSGRAGESARVELSASTPQALATGHAMVAEGAEIALEASVDATLPLSGEAIDSARVASLRVSVPGAGEIALSGEAAWGEAAFAQLDELAASVDLAGALALVSPGYLESLGVAVEADGVVSLDGSLTAYTDEVLLEGTLGTEIAGAAWQAGESSGEVAGLVDERALRLDLRGGDAPSWRYEDEGALSLEALFLSQGLSVQGARHEGALALGGDGEWMARVDVLEIEDLLLELEDGAVAPPAMSLSGLAAWSPTTGAARVERAFVQLASLIEVGASGAYDPPGQRWALDLEASAQDLRTLANVYVPTGGPLLLPEFGGAATLDLNLVGELGSDVNFRERWPLQGEATLSLFDAFAQEAGAWSVAGVGGVASVTLDPGGHGAGVVVDVAASSVAAGELFRKPARDSRLRAAARLDRHDALRVEELSLVSEGLGARVDASATVDGLAPVLAGWGQGTENWGGLRGGFDVDARQELQGLAGLFGVARGEGSVAAGARGRFSPGRGLDALFTARAEEAGLSWRGLLELEGLDGEMSLERFYAAAAGLRASEMGSGGEWRARRAAWLPVAGAEARDGILRLRQLERSLRLDWRVAQVLGGAAAGNVSLSRRGNDPFLSGRADFSGIDTALLDPSRDRGGDSRVSAASSMEWRIGEEAARSLPNDLQIQVKSTSIGRAAFLRMLQAMNPDGDDPRFTNAAYAARLGSPVLVEASLLNSLLTLRAALSVPPGVVAPLPIIEREPIGDLADVYGLSEASVALAALRDALRVLLAESLPEAAAIVSPPPANAEGEPAP